MEQQESNQVNLTLYTVIGNFQRVRSVLKEQFAPVTQAIQEEHEGTDDADRLVLKLQDESYIQFTINHNAEFIIQHINGMANFFRQAPCENEELAHNVIRQIQVFNCVVSCVFFRNEDGNRTNYLINRTLEATGKLNGLLLFPAMELYNGEGKLVFSIQGKSDLEKYTPIGNSDFLDGIEDESLSDIARRERSLAILKDKNIPFAAKLRSAVLEENARCKTATEIAQRLCAIFAVCVYCEANRDEPRKEAFRYVDAMNNLLDGQLDKFLSPQENDFLQQENPAPELFNRFGWRYECCHVLLWALGYVDSLGYPDKLCDVSTMAKLIWSMESLESLVNKAEPRGKAEVLDAADLILRYRWACVDARINGREAPAGLNGEVLYEWHYALNWLISANGGAQWDDIAPHT